MLTLPDAVATVLFPFAMLFQHRTWQKAQVLLIGTILTPGQRTVASALRVMDLSGDRNYARYHHVLNRAAWSPLGASQVLLRLLIGHLDHGDGPLVFGIDETLERRQPPRPSDDASSPWPDGSPARPAASPCTCPRAGPGKTNSAPPWRDYAPCHYPPDRPTASDPSARPPNCLADLRQAGSRVSPAAISPLISPVAGAAVRQKPLRVAITPCAQPDWSGSRPRRLDPAPLILPSLTVARPFRWIWANRRRCCARKPMCRCTIDWQLPSV